MSIDDEEDINLVNEDGTPCTIFVIKMLNFIKECWSSKLAMLKAMEMEQQRIDKSKSEQNGSRSTIIISYQVNLSDHTSEKDGPKN